MDRKGRTTRRTTSPGLVTLKKRASSQTPLSERVQKLVMSPLMAFSLAADRVGGVIRMDGGSPGHGPPRVFTRLVRTLDAKRLSVYSAPAFGSSATRKSASEYFRSRYGIEFDPEHEISITNGFTHAFRSLCDAVLNPDDMVILFAPFFPQYQQPLALAGARLRIVPTRAEDFWKPQPEQLSHALAASPSPRMVVFNYPNNPAGSFLTANDWMPLLRVLECDAEDRRRRGDSPLLLVSDDAYLPLTHSGSGDSRDSLAAVVQHTPDCSLLDSLLIICSLSKEGMAGVLTGLVGTRDSRLVQAIRISAKASVISVSALAELAVHAALSDESAELLTWARSLYAARLQRLAAGINTVCQDAMGFAPVRQIPAAGMYLYVDFSRLLGMRVPKRQAHSLRGFAEFRSAAPNLFRGAKILSSTDLAYWLLCSSRVAAAPFDGQDSCHLRFSVGLPESLVLDSDAAVDEAATSELGLQRIDAGVERIGSGIRSFAG